MIVRIPRGCRRAREILQDSLDQGESLPPKAQAHLAGCGDCRAFQVLLLRLGEEMRQAVDRPMRSPGDYAGIIIHAADLDKADISNGGRPGSRHRARPWIVRAAIAAAFMLVVGIPAWFQFHTAQREKAAMDQEVAAFVQGLYGHSALDGIEYSPGTLLKGIRGLSDWLPRSE